MAKDYTLNDSSLLSMLDSVSGDDLLYQVGAPDESVLQDEGGEDQAAASSEQDSALEGDSAALDADGGSSQTTISVDGIDLSYISSADAALPSSFVVAATGTASIQADYTTDGWSNDSGSTSGCSCPLCGGDSFGGGGVTPGDLAVPAAATTLNTLATYLNERNSGSGGNDFWDEFWGGGSDVPTPFWNLTASGTNARSGVITFNVTSANWFDGNGLADAGRQEAIRNALDVYEDILGINFVESTDANANLVFGDWDSGRAYANFDQSPDGSIQRAWINIAANWSGNGTIGDYYFQTALHEIGHTLGLGHQGNYNAGQGSLTYGAQAQWQNDTIQYTMMSYWAQGNYTQAGYNTPSGAFLGDVNLIGPQIVDWLALDRIYNPQGFGIDDGVTVSNTTWGFNGNWFNTSVPPNESYGNDAFSLMSTLLSTSAMCIVDGGGIDTLDLSGFGNNTLIDLRENSASSTTVYFMNVAGLNGNLSTAVGTVIEIAVGGAGNEMIHGNNANNTLYGGGGNDTLNAYNGVDVQYGGSGNDLFIIQNGWGDGPGALIDGGADVDTFDVSAASLTTSVINLASGTFTYTPGGAGTISLANIENVVGSAGADSIIGNGSDNTLYGGGGNDTLNGGAGVDVQYGGAGDDLFIIENGWNDGPGALIDGGSGNDTFDVSAASLATSVIDLQAGTFNYTPGGSGTISLVGIERVNGSGGADTIILTGNGGEVAWGNGGDDVLSGYSNNQTLYGGAGNDSLYGDGVVPWGSGVADYMDGGDGNDSILGAGGGDTILGGADNDFIIGDRSGFGSADNMDGGSGTDTVSYENSAAGVNVTLNSASNTGGTAQGDTLAGFEVLIGSGWNDTLYGGSGFNATLSGGGGDDWITGGFVSQVLEGGSGNDTLYVGFGEFLDSVDGGSGTDTLDHSAVSASDLSGAVFDFLNGVGTVSFSWTGSITISGIEVYLDGAGGNTIIAGATGGSYYGGDGNDTLVAGAGAEILDGGNGTDVISYASSTLKVNVLLNSATNSGGSAAGDTLAGFEYLIGSGFNDTLDGNGLGGVTIEGGAGRDLITGGFNNQTLYGGDGKDVIYGGESSLPSSIVGDVIYGGGANDRVIAANGDDSVWGGSGQDNIQANAGNDYVDGEVEADIISGGAGFDTLYGSAGADTLNGGDDDDQLYGGDDADLMRGDAGNDVLSGGNGADSMLGGTGFDTLYGDNGSDTMRGDASADWLFGGGELDSMYGGAGNDTMYGGNGNDNMLGEGDSDFLFGEVGNDTLDGGGGIDFLYGGAGTDSLTGGAAADTFVWFSAAEVGNGAGRDVVTDFVSGQDKLNFASIQAGMSFIGVDVAFTGAAGEIRYMSALNQLQCQLDGVGAVDFSLTLAGVLAITGADLILV